MSSAFNSEDIFIVIDLQLGEIRIPDDAQYFRVVANNIEFIKWDYYWYLWIGGSRWCVTMWNRHEKHYYMYDIEQLTQKQRTQEMFGG